MKEKLKVDIVALSMLLVVAGASGQGMLNLMEDAKTQGPRRSTSAPAFYFNRAAAELARGRYEEAIRELNQAIRFHPDDCDAYGVRAVAHKLSGRPRKAFSDYDRAIECAPKKADYYNYRGDAYWEQGNYKKTASDYTKALSISPNTAETLNSIAWFKATCPEASWRNGREALQQARKACELRRWNKWEPIDTLAAAFAETGDFAQAVKYQMQALSIRGTDQDDRENMERRLTLYRNRTAYRDNPANRQARSKKIVIVSPPRRW